jgi:hypothetical protein
METGVPARHDRVDAAIGPTDAVPGVIVAAAVDRLLDGLARLIAILGNNRGNEIVVGEVGFGRQTEIGLAPRRAG